jgi:transposase-like protein
VLVVADPEVPEKARRRRFTAEYKLRILEQADACTEPGKIGELLRREGLYSSHLSAWRKQRREGSLRGLSPRKRGRKRRPKNPLAKKVTQLERENRALQERLRQAEVIIDVQKKVSQILGIPLATPEDTESSS